MIKDPLPYIYRSWRRAAAVLLAAVVVLATMSARRAPRVTYGELRTGTYTYTGGVTDGRQNGFGICRYRNGNVYAGNWNMSYKHGIGRMEFADGTMQFGRWERGIFKEQRGSRFEAGEVVMGIDISRYQENIDWDDLYLKADAAGKSKGNGRYMQPVLFVFVKSTQGNSRLNPQFDRQFREAKKHGIVRGAYHYITENATGRQQAEYFIRHTPLEAGDLPPVLDLEIRREVMRRDHTRIMAIVREWLDVVEEHYGCKPIIYTYDYFYRDYLHGHGYDDYDFWIANYRQRPRFRHCEFWQFTDGGRAAGIAHDVDINLFLGGDYGDFRNYVRRNGIPNR